MRRSPKPLALLLGLLLAIPTWAQQSTGSVTGRVLDTAGLALPGVDVKLQGTSRGSVTDRTGRYRISAVPPGRYMIEATLVGFAPKQGEITVNAGATVTFDAQLIVTISETVVVWAPLLEGQARAINQQKTAPNIMNVVSADQIGQFPDPNVAEAMQRVPGVILQRDDGEGELPILRGVDPRLNSVTINGERMPSTEPQTRAVNFISVSSEILQAVEVSKALTPDQDGDGIGGTINLVTKQAPEKRLLTATLEGGYNDLRETTRPRGSFTWGQRFGKGRWGMILSGSAQDERRANETVEFEYTGTQGDVLDRTTLRDEVAEYQRYSGNAALDWRSDRSSFALRGVFTRQEQNKIRRRSRYERIPGGLTGTGGRVRTELRDRNRQRDLFSTSLGGQTLFGGDVGLEYQFSYNQSHRTEPDTFLNRYEQTGIRYSVSGSGYDTVVKALNQDPTRSAFRFNQYEPIETKDRDLVGQLNLRIPLRGSKPGFVKFGAKLRDKTKDNDETLTSFTGTGLPNMAGALETEYSNPDYLEGRYPSGPYASIEGTKAFFGSYSLTGALDRNRESVDYEAKEDVLAGYGLAEVFLTSKLMLLGGVRYEQTWSDYTGKSVLPTTIVPITSSNSYGNLLPMLHLRYRPEPNSNLRFAATKTLARPSYIDLVPYNTINPETDQITRGNPDLNVTTSLNLDVMYEKYLSSIGIVGGGFFYKRLKDPTAVFQTQETVAGELYQVTQPQNFDKGELWGIEVFVQNQLRMLPKPFDGLGVYFNYTYVDSKAKLPGRPGDSPLPGQTDHTGNAALSYEKGGFSGRIALNYIGDYLFEPGASDITDSYKDSHTQIDVTVSQKIGKVRLFVNLLNINKSTNREYWGTAQRPNWEEFYSWWGWGGIRFDF